MISSIGFDDPEEYPGLHQTLWHLNYTLVLHNLNQPERFHVLHSEVALKPLHCHSDLNWNLRVKSSSTFERVTHHLVKLTKVHDSPHYPGVCLTNLAVSTAHF